MQQCKMTKIIIKQAQSETRNLSTSSFFFLVPFTRAFQLRIGSYHSGRSLKALPEAVEFLYIYLGCGLKSALAYIQLPRVTNRHVRL